VNPKQREAPAVATAAQRLSKKARSVSAKILKATKLFAGKI